MSDALRLLRMLEPVVRPVGATGAARAPGSLPLDQQSFDELLAVASQSDALPGATLHKPIDAGTAVAEVPRSLGLIAALADLGRIENASLRTLIAQHTTDRASSSSTTMTSDTSNTSTAPATRAA